MTLEALKHILTDASKVFVLTDSNVAALWLPEVKHWLGIEDAETLVIEPGEQHKTLQTVQQVWTSLLRQGADRYSVLVNVGGGVVTDLGGFAASCYQRGIRFVNVPTTLLAMVDASFGGKTGVDMAGFKNQIGTFALPLDVVVNPICLSTLPDRELLSGITEMIKYGFIADPSMLKIDKNNYEQYILRAGRIKQEIVDRDQKEQGERKILNFGHTLGHAFESLSYVSGLPLTHGEAVAIGMWCALWLSVKQCGLPEKVLRDYESKLKMLLSLAPMAEMDVEALLGVVVHDKKNRGGQTGWVLLPELGDPSYDCQVPDDLVRQCVTEAMAMLKLKK